MLCQNCNEKEANTQIMLLLNGNPVERRLCEDCRETELREMEDRLSGLNLGMMDGGLGNFADIIASALRGGEPEEPPKKSTKTTTKAPRRRGGFLDQNATNQNDRARNGEIGNVIGREKEVEQVIEILNRRDKNNPVLIGEPGVGKTAIAEALALRIVQGDVPASLAEKEVYLLDMVTMVAGTGIRGQFEAKIKQLISELKERGNVILFIDEIHTLVGAGAGEGAMDASNILKPALARGEIQVIGATTLKEYRIIEKDGALERRFQSVMVNEPSDDETIAILNGIVSRYEEHHEVVFPEDVIKACVIMASRYIQDRFNPDKSIDLLDIAGSKVNLRSNKKPSRDIAVAVENVRSQKERAVLQENYELAGKLRDEEATLLRKLEKQMEQEKVALKEELPEVTIEDIQLIIEQKTGIPVRKIQEEEQAKMKNLAEKLSSSVIGQDEAVQKVAKSIRRARAGLKPVNRPIGSFLFIGPTGVGKTELSKQLAQEIFGTKDAMIRLDMSEYMEKHTVSKLIGAPPGYIGHDEAGGLTEQVRRKPYSIILLDEIEKAHSDVQNVFLQILEDGRLTDSHGKTVSFKDTVIIATSNAGTADKKPNSLGFGQKTESLKESSILDSLKPYFKPEFLNRFDNVVQFKQLEESSLVKIVDLLLVDLQSALSEQGVAINVTNDAKKKLAKLGYDPAFGARPLRRTLQEQVEDKVADLLLDEEGVKAVKVRVSKDEIVVERA